MKTNPIASRILHCVYDGKTEEVIARLGTPTPEKDYFTCEYEFSLRGDTKAYRIAAMDSLQALQLSMFMLGSALEAIPGASHWTWNGAPKTGLPTSLDQPIIGLR